MRMTFEDNLFYHKAIALHRADHAAMQVTPFRKIASQLSHLLAHSGNVCLHVGLRSISLLKLLAALLVALVLPKHQVVEPRLRTAELQGAIVRTTGISHKVIICLGPQVSCQDAPDEDQHQSNNRHSVLLMGAKLDSRRKLSFHDHGVFTMMVISSVLSNPVSRRSRRRVSSHVQSFRSFPFTVMLVGLLSR